MSDADSEGESSLSADERAHLAAIRSAATLSELQAVTGAPSEHDAYLAAKAGWQRLRERELGAPESTEGLPGDRVVVDGQAFHVHGITHADTDAERAFLRRHVANIRDAGEAVYCEQGIRPMYFQDMDAVCEIDDYRWAMHRCQQLDVDSRVTDEIEREFAEGMSADLQSVAAQFRKATFSLIESGSGVYGERFAAALGDVASDFLRSHAEIATGVDFSSFRKSRAAAENPAALAELQQYYRTVFLPQPLEREWLRRHDRELELFTHARNERIAAYVLSHGPDDTPVHIITGAAHQPGVAYYLRAYSDGEWTFEPFEVVP
jgi:hypothetical protein